MSTRFVIPDGENVVTPGSRAAALYDELGLRAALEPKTLQIPARDGRNLTGSLFEARGHTRGTVVIASAMGVPRRWYSAFASYLAEGGLTTLTFDYRGIGDSRQGSLARERVKLSEWAELDLAASHTFAKRVAPTAPLVHVGHSVGGQLLALLPHDRDARVSAALFVGSQHGHYRNWSGWKRGAMATLWFAAVPAVTFARGYLPMSALGQGEDIPGGVAKQWAEWGRDRRYLGAYLEARDQKPVSDLACPIRAYAFADDSYAPERGVSRLLKLFPRAETELFAVHPSDLGVQKVGHFGPFRERAGKKLWPEQRAWLLATLEKCFPSRHG